MAHRELQPPQRALFVMPWVGRVGQEFFVPLRRRSVDKDVTFESPAGVGSLDCGPFKCSKLPEATGNG